MGGGQGETTEARLRWQLDVNAYRIRRHTVAYSCTVHRTCTPREPACCDIVHDPVDSSRVWAVAWPRAPTHNTCAVRGLSGTVPHRAGRLPRLGAVRGRVGFEWRKRSRRVTSFRVVVVCKAYVKVLRRR